VSAVFGGRWYAPKRMVATCIKRVNVLEFLLRDRRVLHFPLAAGGASLSVSCLLPMSAAGGRPDGRDERRDVASGES